MVGKRGGLRRSLQRYASLRKPMPKSQSELPRVLNASHATSIVVGIIIGSGIFLVPREMMAAVGSSRAVYVVWIVGGLLSLFGAMTYAEIAAARPTVRRRVRFSAGGVWRSRGLPLHVDADYGCQTGFACYHCGRTGASPWAPSLVFSFFSHPAFAHLFWGQIFAIAVTWLIAILNIIGTRKSANVQLLLTWLKGLADSSSSRVSALEQQATMAHGITSLLISGARAAVSPAS